MHFLGILLLIWIGFIVGCIVGFFFGHSKGYNQREKDTENKCCVSSDY